ncbi:hypothetical protein [Leucobacter chromiireducens]|uniref:Antitoxin VbhA domain-containing protein n=1 Tax=Leucobacter chromiireducens subsp. solipictus TaxID=398235 RepID=A0ABS1SHZ3_9MICO|nr:hypothetical protein [Leucobacter chromiireducens]MBL3679531.1 hypothetical protein [Leucobacter chromiireducens subsp. solipictus]
MPTLTPTFDAETARNQVVDLQCALADLVSFETGTPATVARETLPDASTLETWLRDRDQHPLDEASAEVWLDRIVEAGLLP